MYLLRTKFKDEITSEFFPPRKKSNKVIIYCSGMPGYPRGEKYNLMAEFFSKKGYWFFLPRYRGSWESEGSMFKESPHLDILDIMDSLQKDFIDLWDGKKYKIDNPEFYLIGSSFGGPAVLLNSKDKRVKKVIASCPVIDWRSEKYTEEPISKLSKFTENAFGNGYRIEKDGWKKIEKGIFYNPATEINNIDGEKCLIIQSKDDNVISLKPLPDFVKKTGSNLILVNKGGHGLFVLDKKFKEKCLKFLKSKS